MTSPLLSAHVSVFRSATKAVPVERIPLSIQLEQIKSGIYQAQIASLRHTLLVWGDKDRYDVDKKALPAFTPAGVFTRRANAHLTEASGLVHFDFDHPPNLPEAKALLSADPWIAYVFVSPSGDGLKVAVWADGIADDRTYKHAWGTVLAYFERTYPDLAVANDKACKDIARLCFVSHDPDLYSNPDARLYVVPREAQAPSPPTPARTASRSRSQPQPTGASEQTRIEHALQVIPADDYETWLRVGMALHASGDPWARATWDTWSAGSDKYDTRAQDEKWASFSSDGGVSLATVFHLAQQHGYVRPRKTRLIAQQRRRPAVPDMTGTTPPAQCTLTAEDAGQSSVEQEDAQGGEEEAAPSGAERRPLQENTTALLARLATLEGEDARYTAVLAALDTMPGLDMRAWMLLKRQIKQLVPSMNLNDLDRARAEVKRLAEDDDLLTASMEAEDLDGLAAAAREDDADDDLHPERRYRETPEGLLWSKPTKEGPVAVLLTNFTARITANVVFDDGVETRGRYEITAVRQGLSSLALVPSTQFAGMGWIAEHLGPRAIVMPGMTLKDHARAAIQLLSHDIAERHIYTHVGWRQLGEHWTYLYAGGAISALGSVPDVTVEPSVAMAAYVLTLPADPRAAQAALLASMQLLTVGPPEILIPLYGALWRAVLGTATMGVHLTGETGKGKSELAALVQQHWGPTMHAKSLPAAWSATANALEDRAFQAKDAVLVIDDFCPRGSPGEVAQLHAKADRVFRAQGNLSARARLDRGGRERPIKPPRGLIVSTGEDIPMGQSLRARVCVLEVVPEAVNWQDLTLCQSDAAAGLYSQALATFVQWLAPHYGTVRATLPQELITLRGAAVQTAHRRTPELVAHLALGWRYFLACAHDLGVLTETECRDLWAHVWTTLGDMALAQQEHQGEDEPVRRFLALLSAAITGGLAHVQDARTLGPPSEPRDWGWTVTERTTQTNAYQEWTPHGACIGWRDGERLYLEPETSYSVAQRLAETQRAPLAITKRTLHKRMHERGLLLRQPSQHQNAVNRPVGPAKVQRRVLDIPMALLTPTTSIFSISSIDTHLPQQNSQIPEYWFPEWTARNQYSEHTNQYSNQYSPDERMAKVLD